MNGWIIDDQTYSQGKRYELPAWPELAAGQDAIEAEGDEACFLLLRPLTDAEALERESIGIVEWYYLDGQEPAVRRTYDLAAMTAYDYRHCILDFRLPVRAVTCSDTHSEGVGQVGEVGQAGAQVRLVAMDADDPDANLRLLQKMPPKLAEWVADCVADVNMRSSEWRHRLQEAKKN